MKKIGADNDGSLSLFLSEILITIEEKENQMMLAQKKNPGRKKKRRKIEKEKKKISNDRHDGDIDNNSNNNVYFLYKKASLQHAVSFTKHAEYQIKGKFNRYEVN